MVRHSNGGTCGWAASWLLWGRVLLSFFFWIFFYIFIFGV